MLTEQAQKTKDEYLRRGFRAYQSGIGEISRAIDAIIGAGTVNKIVGSDVTGNDTSAYVNDTTLPHRMRIMVHANLVAPTSLDQQVSIALWVSKNFKPIDFTVTNSAVAFKFIDTLVETNGDVQTSIEAAYALDKEIEERKQAETAQPKNEGEAAVIAHYAQYGYTVKHMGPVRALHKEFNGGWHGVTVPSADNTTGDLPQSLDEPVETALHLDHGDHTGTAVASAPNSYKAIEAGEAAIAHRNSMLSKQPIGSWMRNGQMVS